MDPFTRGEQRAAGGLLTTSSWVDPTILADIAVEAARKGSADDDRLPLRLFEDGCVFLGESADGRGLPIGWKDDRHLVTIAGSRAGKGQSAIIPNLRLYSGSVFCIDPKGENAKETAEHRAKPKSQGGLGQEVYVLDPYEVSGVDRSLLATFNPLWMVDLSAGDPLEQVGSIADSLVVPTDAKDAHWDDSARNLIEAVILHVLSWPHYADRRTLGTVRELISQGEAAPGPAITFPGDVDDPPMQTGPFESLFETMVQNPSFGGVIAGLGHVLLNMAPSELSGVLSTAQRNTKFLDGSCMPAILAKSSHNLSMRRFALSKRGATVYVCLPARYMATHSRWLRLVLNSLMVEMERFPMEREAPRVLTILDEFPILGRMRSLETAVGYMAGFGLKIWTILQDINQLRRDYPDSWETFLGNAGLCQYFGNSDRSTLEFISKNLGEVEVAPEITSITETTGSSRQNLSDADMRERLKKQTVLSRQIVAADEFITPSEERSTQTQTSPNLMKTALMTPDEIAREFSKYKQRQLLVTPDVKPFYLNRVDDHATESHVWRQYRRGKPAAGSL